MDVLCSIIIVSTFLHLTLQHCPEEISSAGISVTWHETPTANNVESDPQCYNNDTLITRNCSDSKWTPELNELTPCLKIVKYFDLSSCPPGFNKVSEENKDYCYQISKPSAWDYPCLSSGGASVISDLSPTDVEHLLKSLKESNTSRNFWLPARKERLFHPILWTIPGPNWGKSVPIGDPLGLQLSLGNCLSLDTELNVLRTKSCSNVYPSLCFYVNKLHNPLKCPPGYNSFRFTPDHGACYGIAKSDTPEGLSYHDFRRMKCNKPMCDDDVISRFIFKQIAELNELPNDVWCWFEASHHGYSFDSDNNLNFQLFEGIINNAGVLGFTNYNFSLPCMACEAEVIYAETELMFEYNDAQNVIYLTVYHPSGLWRYNEEDKGIQCFSNAKGFVKVVNINENPFMNVKSVQHESDSGQIEKIVYVIDLVTDSSAQYWCEGHTVNFSLITTNRMVVNPRGNQIHVFCLVITQQIVIGGVLIPIDIPGITKNITDIFNAKKVLIMDVSDSEFDLNMYIVLHLHIEIDNTNEEKALNIQTVYDKLKNTAESELSKFEYTFVNLSSSIYCLPTVSIDKIKLDWDMTPIGHIAAPKQFCLQSNGLPVKRRCEGSYILGSKWGKIEGHCDSTYEPSRATAFLYNFLTRPNIYVSEFLIEGLTYVLGDTDIIIPADIYYLSMSLQQISNIAQNNVSSIETTNLDHIAWIMDRVTILDCDYLRLAQTLNSTNVIVDSMSAIIEIIAKSNFNDTSNKNNNVGLQHFRLAVQPQFVVQISYPYSNNITGIAVVSENSSDNFTDMLIYPLYKNTTLEDVLAIKNLEIATWIPGKMMDSLLKLSSTRDTLSYDPNLHIIITIYHNDAVFQEIHDEYHSINSRIIGISIPDYISNLHYPIPIVFKQLNNATKSFCGYWDFHPQLNNVPGSWKKNGCFMVKSIGEITVCECYHLTHFGQLLVDGRKDDQEHNIGHLVALNIITLIGSFLSLLGIAGIWITALVFSNWRKKAGTKVLLQLSTAISLPLIFIITFNLHATIVIRINDTYSIAPHMKISCLILGALLHFSILASFMWMLITAILQFIRYVRVLGVKRPSRFMIKFSLIGWGIPLFPVIMTLALDPLNYIPAPSTTRKICYPSGNYLIFAVLVPVCIILLVNIILFISVLHAISRRSNAKVKTTDMDLVGAQLRVSIFLFFLLGLTWVFGIFSFSSLLWSYLFCLTSTLQGFVLFIYFVICDPSTRGLWVTLMKPQFTSNSCRKSITSMSTG